jgi:hypothetical protein
MTLRGKARIILSDTRRPMTGLALRFANGFAAQVDEAVEPYR